MLTHENLVTHASNVRGRLSDERAQAKLKAEEKARTQQERYTELFDKIVARYVKTLRALDFRKSNSRYTPLYAVNPTPYRGQGPSLRVQYSDGGHGSDNLYLNIDIDKGTASFSGEGVKKIELDFLTDENIDLFLLDILSETMNIAV